MPDGGWVATFEDVTEQRRAQARIAHMARHDGLTNLPNRYAFRERIQEALRGMRRRAARMLAVMCLDLDNFKEVNDTLGHPTGDALLCAAAERLTACVRETDMVARFGGDEFAILQPACRTCRRGRAPCRPPRRGDAQAVPDQWRDWSMRPAASASRSRRSTATIPMCC